ncbi:replication initiation protein [Streptomyces microflavus]|uniref:replication initiation protein n=1 Tax=Streptomyces microflavus TaxID=1919 RepID=UPI0036F123CE
MVYAQVSAGSSRPGPEGHPITPWIIAALAPSCSGRAAVTEGLRRALDEDAAYSGLMTKNPLHVDWSTEWLPGGLHTLGGLEEALSGHMPSARWREIKRFRTNIMGLGRNCSIFETARTWAYREVLHHFGSPDTLHTAIHAEVRTRNARVHGAVAGRGGACDRQQHPPVDHDTIHDVEGRRGRVRGHLRRHPVHPRQEGREGFGDGAHSAPGRARSSNA